jgi:hypothetical protein
MSAEKDENAVENRIAAPMGRRIDISVDAPEIRTGAVAAAT